jgi:hypothetical protein
MELIQFNKNGGPVTIDVDIAGASIWSYIYVGDFTFKNKSTNTPASNHTLGLPVNLDDDINSWDIRIGNISGSAIQATAKITWRQNGNVLNVWTKQVTVPAQSATKVSDDALLAA